MRTTRHVDQYGNVSYTVTTAEGVVAGTIYKMCNGRYQVEPIGRGGYWVHTSIRRGVSEIDRYWGITESES